MNKPRLIRALLLTTTIIATPSLAHADPATLAQTAVTVAATAANAIPGVGPFISAAIQVGGNLLVQSLFSQNTAAQQGESRTRKFDPHPPFRFAFGEFPQEGSVIFHHAEGEVYYAVYLLNSIPSDSISRIEINDGLHLPLESPGTLTVMNDTNLDYKGGSDVDDSFNDFKNGRIIFWFGDGTHTQPPQLWLDEIGDVIQETDIWQGLTVMFVRIDHSSNANLAAKLWTHGKPPPLKFFGKWSKLYDPRLDPTSGVTQFGTISPGGTHDRDDRTTWEWSANPALAALMLVRHEFALGFDDEMIPIQQWADAADDCDVQDGAVASSSLHTEDWTGSAPALRVAETDPGSGVWTYSKGSVALATGGFSGLSGENVCRLFSEDTDGTLADSELGKMGVYFDMTDESRRGDVEYLVSSFDALAGETPNDKWRVRVYKANKITPATDGDDVGATAAEQLDTFMPSDALSSSITLLDDTGYGDFTASTTEDSKFTDVSHTGDYLSVVIEGGAPNEDYIEVGPRSISTVSQAAKTRFQCDGMVVINEREISLLDPVLSCMAAHLDTTDGLLGVRAGVWVAPTDSLSQPVGDEIRIDGARDAGFDMVRAKFIGRHREWEETDGPGYRLRTGARVHPLELPLVQHPEQAARLEKIAALRAEPNRIVTGLWDGREINRRIGERVNFSLAGFQRAESTYVILSKSPHTREVDDGVEISTQLTLQEDVASTYDWSGSDYVEVAAFTPSLQKQSELAAPTSVNASQDNTKTDPNGTSIARLKIVIAITTDLSNTAEDLVVEINTGGGYTWLTTITVVAGTTSYTVYVDPATAGTTYTARAKATSTSLGPSAYTTSSSVAITTPATSLSAPTFVSESHDGNHTRTLTTKSPNQSGVQGMKMYVHTSNDRANASLMETGYVGANSNFAFTDGAAFDGTTRWYWATTFDANGAESADLVLGSYTPVSATGSPWSSGFDDGFGA